MTETKKYHLGAEVNQFGQVSALCFKRPRPIDLKKALWTNRKEAVTCESCLKELRNQSND